MLSFVRELYYRQIIIHTLTYAKAAMFGLASLSHLADSYCLHLARSLWRRNLMALRMTMNTSGVIMMRKRLQTQRRVRALHGRDLHVTSLTSPSAFGDVQFCNGMWCLYWSYRPTELRKRFDLRCPWINRVSTGSFSGYRNLKWLPVVLSSAY